MLDLIANKRIDELSQDQRNDLHDHVIYHLNSNNVQFTNYVWVGGRVIGWSLADSDFDLIVYHKSATFNDEKNLLPIPDFMGKPIRGIYRHPNRASARHGMGQFLLPKRTQDMTLIDHNTQDLQAWYEECKAFRITFGQRDFSNCIQVFND